VDQEEGDVTRSDQKKIVISMCDSLKEYLLERLDKVPEDWDGHELRYWFAARAHSEFRYRNMSRGRVREYNNTILVRNL
jgi:hypothetical protein